MGHRNTAFQEFVLTYESPWNLAGKTVEDWSQSFYVSGTITHNDADAESAGLALAAPALALATSKTSLIGITYYPSGSVVSTTNKVYVPGTHPGTASAYTSQSQAIQQLEVAAVAHCPIGKNIRGKEIFLRKYFHNVQASLTDANALDPVADAAALLHVYNAGAGPHNVVPCSPSTGASASAWTLEAHLFTHQLRKGKKRKKTQSQSLFDSVANAIGEAAALELLKKALSGAAAAG